MSVTTEVHEQWVGIAYVVEHGLPGYPPPIPNARTTSGRKVRFTKALREGSLLDLIFDTENV